MRHTRDDVGWPLSEAGTLLSSLVARAHIAGPCAASPPPADGDELSFTRWLEYEAATLGAEATAALVHIDDLEAVLRTPGTRLLRKPPRPRRRTPATR